MALTQIRFKQPPVVEVVFGVTFNSQRVKLQTPHIGLFWDRVRSQFPLVTESTPLNSIIEGVGIQQSMQVELLELPPLRRVLFASEDGRKLLQLQEDRLHFNWKKGEQSDSYPSYDEISPLFFSHLEMFAKFISDENLGEIEYRQFELTYVNHLGPDQGIERVPENAALIDHIRHEAESRFLPLPEVINWSSAYLMPDNFGRLHVSARTAVRKTDQQKILRVDLVARGIPPESSRTALESWFGVAHDWITHGFADVTSPKLHEIWGRIS